MPRTIFLSPSTCGTAAASSTACQNIFSTTSTSRMSTVAQHSLPLFTRAKLLTRFLISSGPLPPSLQRHGALLLFATGAAIGSGLYHFFQRYKESAGKVQLAVFHIIRMVEGLPDLEERLQKPQELIAAIEQEVLELVEVHGQISKGEGESAVRELKRKVWRVVDERIAGEREEKRRKKIEKEEESEEDEDEDVEMKDIEDDSPTPPIPSPKQDISTPTPTTVSTTYSLNYEDQTLYSPSSTSSKPKPMLESATRRAFGFGPVPPVTQNKLTRGRGPGTALSPLPEGSSPQQSPGQGRLKYRVAETRRLWRELEGKREWVVEEGSRRVDVEVKKEAEKKKEEEKEGENIVVVATPSPPKKKRGRPRKELGKERLETPRRNSSRSSAYKGGYRV